jgi:N-sulfoglucosamine sulfohydrolase
MNPRFTLALCLLFPAMTPASQAADRPNILLILADDQTWHDVGCYGNKDVRTPNIDRLAGQGMRFTHAFTATAMCAPTRAQLYTGLFPVRNGAYPNHSRVYKGTKSIVHYLKALGYRVGLAGKKHFGPPASFPFETVPPRALARFINRAATQPYCLIVASHSPHLPWTQGDARAYDPDKLTLPPYLVDTPETRQALTRYYAEITDFDREVGECLTLVEKSGQANNTLFLYTSEQGAQFPRCKWTCYDTGLRTAFVVRWPGKVQPGAVSDAMIQYVDVVPTLIEAAGGTPPKELDGKSFLPVLLGKADKHREVVYGVHTTRGIIQGSACYPIRSIRTRTHKYIWNLKAEEKFQNVLTAGRDRGGYWLSWVKKAKTDAKAARFVTGYQQRPAEELYDLSADPYELNNLAEDPRHRELKEKLRKQLLSWMEQQGDRGIETELQANSRQGKQNRE